MTRELKLALIISVTVLLGVMILISDHLSVQRRPKLAEVSSVQPPMTPPPPAVDAPGPVETAKESGEASPKSDPKATSTSETLLAKAENKPAEPVAEIHQRTAASGKSLVSRDDLPPAAGTRIEYAKIDSFEPGVPVPGKNYRVSNVDFSAPVPSPVTGPKVTEPSVSGRTRVVESGDSAYKIARDYLGDGKYWKKIVEANPKLVSADGQVKVGATLVIPSIDAPAPKSTNVAPATTPTRLADAGMKSKSGKAYTVRRGDTLHSIAKKELGSSGRADEILKLNKSLIKDPGTLPQGLAILLPEER